MAVDAAQQFMLVVWATYPTEMSTVTSSVSVLEIVADLRPRGDGSTLRRMGQPGLPAGATQRIFATVSKRGPAVRRTGERTPGRGAVTSEGEQLCASWSW